MKANFILLIVILVITSCAQRSSFQKQKYLKGNLKECYGEAEYEEVSKLEYPINEAIQVSSDKKDELSANRINELMTETHLEHQDSLQYDNSELLTLTPVKQFHEKIEFPEILDL